MHEPMHAWTHADCDLHAQVQIERGVGSCRGYNIGIRLVDEFLAKARMGKCSSFRETAEVIAKQAFVMFINVQCTVTNWSQDARECSLVGRARSWGFVPLRSFFMWAQYGCTAWSSVLFLKSFALPARSSQTIR